MQFNLQKKLMLLLLAVIVITLSSAVLVRNLLVRDFRAFGEGRMIDRLYQIQAVLEGRYQQQLKWQSKQIADDLVWARLMGFETRLFDAEGNPVLDTRQALSMIPDSMQQRVAASLAQQEQTAEPGEFHSYPLFMGGEEIGHLDVRFPRPPREQFFISSSNKFLTYSVLGLGLIAIILSVIAARRLARPLQELTAAAEGIAAGNAARRVQTAGHDEIGRLAAAFNQMADALEQQERMRKQLVSNAAHELRTPLMVIRGELEGMLDGLLPTSKDALQSLHDETSRLTGILDGVDELTRAQAAFFTLQLREVPLLPFLGEVLSRFTRQAEEQRVQIAVEGDRGISVRIDPDLFTRIIINLISNALRAMPDGGLLRIAGLSESADSVAITVADTGEGIPEDQLPHIFERFYKGSEGGLGLGLAIVKELVEAHKGVISVTSKPGMGTCFRIELPDNKEITG